jgi:hypothetical protein
MSHENSRGCLIQRFSYLMGILMVIGSSSMQDDGCGSRTGMAVAPSSPDEVTGGCRHPKPRLRQRDGLSRPSTGAQRSLSAADMEQLNRRAVADAFRSAACLSGPATPLALPCLCLRQSWSSVWLYSRFNHVKCMAELPMLTVATLNIELWCNIYCLFCLNFLSFWRVQYMGVMN